MKSIMQEMDELRIALGEVDALSLVTADAYDREDWIRPDSVLVERIASLLGLISKSAGDAMSAFHRLHAAIADAAPEPPGTGDTFDYSDGTAPGRDAESIKREDDAIAEMTGQK